MEKYKQDWYWLNDFSVSYLKNGYIPEDKDIKEHFKEFSEKVGRLTKHPELVDKIYSYIAKGYYLIPTPGITNFLSDKESPISCFGSSVSDSVKGLLYTDAEIGMMSKIGGGTSAYLGHIRAKGSPISGGGFADGVMRYVQRLQDTTGYISQRSRRGKVATYLDFNHGEIEDYLTIQDKTSIIQEVPFGICISDEDYEKINKGDYKSREIWAKVIKKKFEKGFPYIFNTGNVNKNRPDCYKEHIIKNSNLCTEVLLPTNDYWSFVCCILAVNLFHFDEFPEDVVDVAFYILEAFLLDFISKSENNPLLTKAVKFAKENMAVGLGASAWHSYLKKNMIPIESMEAKMTNVKIFKWLQKKSLEASLKLGGEYGECLMTKGTGRRNTTTNAIAPNTSSSEIVYQWSQSIEPSYSNAFIKGLAKNKYLYKDHLLNDLFDTKGINSEEIWESIVQHNGSVQHLKELSELEKRVFKTFEEISPMELLIQNSQRQKYIDQGVSFNTMIPQGTSAKDVSKLYLKAHELGIKTLYYQLNKSASQSFTQRSILECDSCAG